MYIRQDMTQLGAAGRLVTAFIKFMYSVDAGTSAFDNPSTNIYGIYRYMLFSLPPQSIMTQVLNDIAAYVQFAPGTADWGFETSGYNITTGLYLPPFASSANSAYPYNLYTGAGSLMFSVWRTNPYPDYYYLDQYSQLTDYMSNQIADLQTQINTLVASLNPRTATALAVYSHSDTGEVIALNIPYLTYAVNVAAYSAAFSASVARLLHMPTATIQVTDFQQSSSGGTKVYFNVVLAGTSSSSSEVVIGTAADIQALFTSSNVAAPALATVNQVFANNGLSTGSGAALGVFYQDF